VSSIVLLTSRILNLYAFALPTGLLFRNDAHFLSAATAEDFSCLLFIFKPNCRQYLKDFRSFLFITIVSAGLYRYYSRIIEQKIYDKKYPQD
jgi:hypothetical protein